MKKFLFLTLTYLVLSALDPVYEEIQGPAYNAKNGGPYSCSDRYVWKSGKWLDDNTTAFIPGGVSDCVDLQLWNPGKKAYYDRCCYVRFQVEGKMHAGCVGLSEENYLDTTITKERMEQGDRDLWTRNARNSKIYQLDCFSSYIKSLSIASILLLALFF